MSAMRRWGIGAGIAVVVILAAGWFLLVKPQNAKVSDLHTQAAAQNQQNAQLLTEITALQAEAKNNAQEQRILERFATQIPDTAGEPALIRALSQTAKGAGVDLVSITPGDAVTLGAAAATTGTQTLGATAPTGSLYSLPLSLSVTGSYSNLESFFSGIEHLPRAFMVSGFRFLPATPAGAATATALAPNALSATISTSVFYSDVSTTAAAPTTTTPGSTGTTAPNTSATTNPAAPAADVARQGAGQTS